MVGLFCDSREKRKATLYQYRLIKSVNIKEIGIKPAEIGKNPQNNRGFPYLGGQINQFFPF